MDPAIVEARRHGKRPLVVPRDHRLGEHVDGHQLRFARRLADEGLIVLCEQRDELTAALDAARRDPDNLTLVGGAQPGQPRSGWPRQWRGSVGSSTSWWPARGAASRAGCAGLGENPLGRRC